MMITHNGKKPDTKISRRKFIQDTTKICTAIAAGGFMGTGFLAGCGSSKNVPNVNTGKMNGEVIVRALGGAYQEAEQKAIFTPFTEATGIKVTLVPTTAAQVITMVESGKVKMDVLDLGARNMMGLENYLEKLEYDKFKFANVNDIPENLRLEKMVGNIYFSTVMVYNKNKFGSDHPKNWAEFWDVAKYPGARTLADVKSGSCELEFAMLAQGTPLNRIYPLDVAAAFNSLSKVKSAVVKWWDTGAVSAELLSSGEAVLGGIWNGRVQDLIDKGAPLAIEWNQAKRQLQCWSIVKGAPNRENAMKFIDFALQPKIQAELTKYIAYGPTNKEAFKYIRPEDAEKLPSSPEHYKVSFDQDDYWWMNNYKTISGKWNSWILEG